jgi:DNA-binding MarR family transcriptional regulator
MSVIQAAASRAGQAPSHGFGSQQALRIRNLDALLREVQNNGPGTQRELAERTGLSAATVSNLVQILLGEKKISASPTISSGRRATLISVPETS